MVSNTLLMLNMHMNLCGQEYFLDVKRTYGSVWPNIILMLNTHTDECDLEYLVCNLPLQGRASVNHFNI